MVKKLLSILFCLVMVSAAYSAEFDADSDGVFDASYKFKVDNLVHTSTTAISANVITLLSQSDFAGVKAQLSVDDLVTLSGVADGAANLGTFTGGTIADSQTIKAAIQALETGLEDAQLAAVAGLTFQDASVIQLTGETTAAVLTSGGNHYFLKSNSDNSALEFAAPADAISALDGDLVTAALADEAGASKYFGTDGDGVVGFHAYSTTGLGFDLDAPGAANALLVSNGTKWERATTLSNFAITGLSTTAGTAVVSDGTGALSQTFDALLPDAADGAALGSAAAEWSDLFLADGGIIKGQNDQSNTITSSATAWTFNLDVGVQGGDITIADAGVKLTGSNGSLTILGLGDGQDEDVKIDLNTTANTIEITSPASSATTIDINTLNLVATGTISGAVPSTTDADGMSITTAQAYGYIHWATGAGTWVLPAAATGMSVCVYSTTAAAIVINPDDSDVIVLNGTALSAGDSITSSSTAGDFVCLAARDTTNWHTMGRNGTWTDTN